MKLKNIKIGTKLLASYLIIAALTGVVGYIGITKIHEIDDADTMLYEKMTVPIVQANEMANCFHRIRVNVRDYIHAQDEMQRQKYYDRIFELKSEFDKTAIEYEKLLFTDDGRKLFQNSVNAMNKYISYVPQIKKHVSESNLQASYEVLSGEMQKANEETQKALNAMVESKLSLAKQTAEINTKTANAASSLMITVTLLAAILSVVIGLIISNGIVNPLAKGVKFAQEIASGDLTTKLNVDQRDEVGQLGVALGQMKEKLKEVISNVTVGADNIVAASMQMSSTSQQVSQGASEQASASEEVTSSIEEMVSSIQQNADNSHEAEKIARKGAKGIEEGSRATMNAVESMKLIAEKISFIDEIARQTNILALNAAIEAARAGEHGRGFAVVADEVRKLAERSRVAAQEINEISKKGIAVAENAGKLLEDLVPEIQRTAQLVQEISAATNEQNSGASQINNAIQQLNSVTQQNAAASEEMATASEELAAQAQQLKELMEYFKLDQSLLKQAAQGSHQVYTRKQKAQPYVAHLAKNPNSISRL